MAKGWKFNSEQLKRLSDAHLGNTPWNKGLKGVVKLSEQTKKKMSIARSGSKHWHWKGGKASDGSIPALKKKIILPLIQAGISMNIV